MATTRIRRPGTMRERPPGSGRWQLRVYLGPDPFNGRPLQSASTFVGTERAAAKELAKLVARVEDGIFDSAQATVGELLDQWLEQITP